VQFKVGWRADLHGKVGWRADLHGKVGGNAEYWNGVVGIGAWTTPGKLR